MYPVPAYVWILVLGYAAAIVVLPALALARGGAPRTGLALGAGLGAAMLASGLLAGRGVYRQDAHSFVWVGIPMAGLLTVLLLGSRAVPVRRALAHPAMPVWLAPPQAFRLAGIVFVTLAISGDLAAGFGFAAGLGDIAVGAGAAAVAWRARRGTVRRGAVFWYNVFGLFDIAVAVFLGVTSAPGLLNLLRVTPTTAPMTLLPLALIPSVGVPVMVAMHIASLRGLSRAAAGDRFDHPVRADRASPGDAHRLAAEKRNPGVDRSLR